MKQTLQDQLVTCLGDDAVLTDNASCVLYAQDVFTKDQPAALVIQPKSTEQLSSAVGIIAAAGYKVIPRGGGMSYTKGYVPTHENSVVVDMSGMNRILEINTEDMYVKVECGCSWLALHQALSSTGFRTPFFGTLSGRFATVGGGLSQNAIFWGSGQHGFAVDSVLSLDVVIADGNVISTGSAAQQNGSPFNRHYGPDLTGLFCSDNSLLGCKAVATLRLIKQLPESDGVSFCFNDFEQQATVMSEVARQGLASECCGFDPFLQAQRLKRESIGADVKNLMGVMKSAGGLGKALKAGAKVALAGRDFLEQESWSVHFMTEDRTAAAVADKMQNIRDIAAEHGAIEVENTIPKVLKANPFGPVNNMVGPNGERWAPVHALVPHSKAKTAYIASCDVFSEHQHNIDKYNIGIGYLLATVSSTVFVLEPVFFWPDELNELHRHAIEPSHSKKLKGFAADPAARAAVADIRNDLIKAYAELGAVHMQIGKTYPYSDYVDRANLDLLATIKRHVDSSNVINPGVLGDALTRSRSSEG